VRYEIDGSEVSGGWQSRLFIDEDLKERAERERSDAWVQIFESLRRDPEDGRDAA
jgi:hypothetical protein